MCLSLPVSQKRSNAALGKECGIARVAAEKQNVYFLRAFADGVNWQLMKLENGLLRIVPAVYTAVPGGARGGWQLTGLQIRAG